MPVTITRIESGIYRYQWLGVITMEDLNEAFDEAVNLTSQYNDNPHVQILDLSEVKRYPVELRGLGKVSDMQRELVRSVLVVAAPTGARVLGRTLKRIVPSLKNMEFYETLDEALAVGRKMLHGDLRTEHGAPGDGDRQ